MSREPFFFTKVPDGLQTWTCNILLVEEKGAQIAGD
jgi:hypothetical protein